VDKRRRDLDTIKRLAEWIEPWGRRWTANHYSSVRQYGPVIELELGYRVANHVLNPSREGN
jgi:predicted unusual protein kinase regulating ubiquinone biosynthesis (AarF/ABC1/UbiB family)